jgi:mono/diheme cytochrome c family protein
MTAKLFGIFVLAALGSTLCAQNAPYVRHTNSSTPVAASATNSASTNATVINARTLFLRNCAHCHGATAHGDDGPDLHDLDLSDDWIANRIRKGKAGEMTAFAKKLQPAEIAALVAYVQSLK